MTRKLAIISNKKNFRVPFAKITEGRVSYADYVFVRDNIVSNLGMSNFKFCVPVRDSDSFGISWFEVH